MAINFKTNDPQGLLRAFKSEINAKKCVTWSYDEKGYFTHTPQQWKFKAWLKPTIYNGQLTMNIVGRKDEATSSAVYAVYHGRFIEAMLTHCDDKFVTGDATSMPTNTDIITTRAA